jgi:hypothetical protein
LNKFNKEADMRRRLQVRLGLLGFSAGALITWPFGLTPFALLPILTAGGGLVMAEWLYAHVGEVSLPRYAAVGTLVCAVACGLIFPLVLAPFTVERYAFWAFWMTLVGFFYSTLWALPSWLVVRAIVRRPFPLAPVEPLRESGPYR